MLNRKLLRQARTRAGLTVNEVARAAGVNFARAYNLEAGFSRLTPEAESTLRRALARLLAERRAACDEMLQKLDAA